MEVENMKNTTGITAVYIRRSLSDSDNNSLSLESQKTECINSLGEKEEYRVYCDEGKSGKNIEGRPAFSQLLEDVKCGLISRIVVKKYDRFSRNMRDYLNVTNLFDSYGVGVTSLTEPFNTETKEGRMMRNTLLNFAEFERETIAGRCKDSYSTRSVDTGFYLGGQVYYGFIPERREVNGKVGSVLVPSDKAEVVRIAYELYKNPANSLQDIIVYFRENGIDINKSAGRYKTGRANMDNSHFSLLLGSPLYVRADKAVYQHLVSIGYHIVDDISAFDGVHGLFRHKKHSEDKYIKVGYHEGIVDSETWLAVQDRKANNRKIPNRGGKKISNTWLTGLLKCEYCGFSVNIHYNGTKENPKARRYYLDSGAYRVDGCLKKRLQARPDYVEDLVFNAMTERIKTLEIAKRAKKKPDTETEKIKADIIRCEDEIRKLLDKLADADEVLFDYIQGRVKILHEKKSNLNEKLNRKTRKRKEIDTAPLSEPLSRWNALTLGEKNALAKTMIEVITISDENGVDIRFCI
jgi:DNA invertase Pin-like site-specific DNA recombinase